MSTPKPLTAFRHESIGMAVATISSNIESFLNQLFPFKILQK
jgi:hypothetical protein